MTLVFRCRANNTNLILNYVLPGQTHICILLSGCCESVSFNGFPGKIFLLNNVARPGLNMYLIILMLCHIPLNGFPGQIFISRVGYEMTKDREHGWHLS